MWSLVGIEPLAAQILQDVLLLRQFISPEEVIIGRKKTGDGEKIRHSRTDITQNSEWVWFSRNGWILI